MWNFGLFICFNLSGLFPGDFATKYLHALDGVPLPTTYPIHFIAMTMLDED